MNFAFLTLLEYPFIQRALIASIVVALVCGFMGILTVLKRSALIGDVLAHTSLLGVAMALLFGFDPRLGALAVALVTGYLLTIFEQQSKKITQDSLLGVILPVSLGLSIVLMSIKGGYIKELSSYLFGSILSVSQTNFWLLIFLAAAVGVVLFFNWNKLILWCFDEDMSTILGNKQLKLRLIFQLLLSTCVVITTMVVGVILTSALLIIPASIARILSRSLRQMVFLTPIIGVVTMVVGFFLAALLNLPTGPVTAVVGGSIFICSLGFDRLRKS